VTPDFVMRGSIARNYRFPTVTELFQRSARDLGSDQQPYLQPDPRPITISPANIIGKRFGGNVARRAAGQPLRGRSLELHRVATALTSGVLTTQQSNIDKVRFRGIEAACR